MEPQKPGNSLGVAKEPAVQRVRSWTVQNEMRDFMGRMSAGRTLDFANPRERRD